jgi:Flp pilus assembly protein TadG
MQIIRQKGSQLIEFALVLPVFLLIIVFIMDISLTLYNKTIISMASRDAARRAAVLSTNTSYASIITDTCTFVRTSTITLGTQPTTCSASGPNVTVTPATAPAFNVPVVVTVTYPFVGIIFSAYGNTIGGTQGLSASTEMLHE